MFDALWRVVLGVLLGLAGNYLLIHPLAPLQLSRRSIRRAPR
jgi:hypothetical protein